MTKLDALKLVLELAEQNALRNDEAISPELVLEQARQHKAIAKVRVMINNREAALKARSPEA